MNYKDRICIECKQKPAHCGDPKKYCVQCANEFLLGHHENDGCLPLFRGNPNFTLPDPSPSQENAIRIMEDG